MTVSTNGQICFGIAFEEGFKFPWNKSDDDDGENALCNWWIYEVHGFKNDFELYDEAGNYLGENEPSKEEMERYYGPRQKFIDEHPLPIRLVNYCSNDYPMYILAIPQTVKINHRGDAIAFNPADLVVTLEETRMLQDFCLKHGISMSDKPKWYLSSVWI